MIFHMASCGGCRTCEMACSFKHKGEFAPSISSLKIMDREDGDGFDVMFLKETGKQGTACDGCKEREVPLCVEYCHMTDDLKEILLAFLERWDGQIRKDSVTTE